MSPAATDWATLQPVLWLSVLQTIYMVFWTMLIAGALGLLLGVALHTTRAGGLYAHRGVFTVLNVLVNLVRPIPFIIFITAVGPLTLLVMGTTIGTRSVLFPMIAMATFFIGRIVEQNLVSVDPAVVEAARAMGASRFRIVWSVLIPRPSRRWCWATRSPSSRSSTCRRWPATSAAAGWATSRSPTATSSSTGR